MKKCIIGISQEIQKLVKLVEGETKPFMSLQEAAEYLSLKTSTLYAYCHKRVIKFYKVRNRKIFFLKSDLDQFVINDENLVKSREQIEEEAIQHLTVENLGGGK